MACGGTSSADKTSTAAAGAKPAATAAATNAAVPTVAATKAAVPTVAATTSAMLNPCTLRTSLENQPLVDGKAFALDANTKWQFCYGGAAAGSNEKFLFHTDDGGATWALISRTTLGSPPSEAGVGTLPNGLGVGALFFVDATNGWLGLTSPGANLYRSTDGGTKWTNVAVSGLDPAVPVQSITFTDSVHGSFTTPTGTWTTSDGGVNWAKSP